MAKAAKTEVKIKKGDKVKVDYTGKLTDGTMFDTSTGREPLCFTLGAGQVIPGFEKALEGMALNQSKTIKIPSGEAYGPVIKEMIIEIPRSKLPPEPEPKVGMHLLLRSPQGQNLPAKIVAVEKDKVTLDLNHPLAGKDLCFEIKVVGINDNDDSGDKECGCGECSGCSGGCGH